MANLRSSLIKLASTFPAGSKNRKDIIAVLKQADRYALTPFLRSTLGQQDPMKVYIRTGKLPTDPGDLADLRRSAMEATKWRSAQDTREAGEELLALIDGVAKF